jgi:DNA-binding NarL/FixJ family response regulator
MGQALGDSRSGSANRDQMMVCEKLTGSLTALLLYLSELNKHRNRIDGADLQQMAVNALQQAERAIGLAQQLTPPANQPIALLAAQLQSLTPREREVVELITNGRSNKQGAALLNISPRTYESHRAVAMRKLKVRNLAELVRVVLTASFER